MRTNLISDGPTIMPAVKAYELESYLSQRDPDWCYEVELVGEEMAKIAIYDGDYKLGYL